ncbi:glycoside hydrolase family 16 protein [Streptococcus didelphis]|uniref:Glycoside hydrolase family 16 protein n=2 Tax=Streptococcus didelphis TaxID=102886 RepID=A0ABY9LGH2_9STRE|nr:glycoside hydrolase family 16 protein [Streptococcus didelphis]WMB27981.1 glycoside hydrolase family 16 protein [Streptococcus didelphis]WMB29552.1 glycoside hydrolase family 16 protein [Streptococcus didelphis]
MARLPKGKTDQDPEKLVNLAQLKAPYVYGQIPSHLNYINDGKFDDNYAINKSLGKDSFIQYEFKNAYTLKSIRLKVKPGSYSQFRVDVDDDADPKKSSKTLYNKHNLKVNQDEIITIPLEEGIETQYVRFTAVRADGAPTAYSEIEILGYGDSYDEAGPTYSDRSSKYNTLVWSDEFNGEQVDQSKWNIIDGMVNHAAIYNKKAVSIKKEGDESYLAINSKNYGSSQALVDAVGRDAYSNDKLDKKVTWSSGRIEAKDKYSFQNGRVLVRAKVNDSQGIWPAIWMLAQDETGHDEIDIMEYLGQNPWDIWTTNHYGILDKNKASHGQANKNYEAWSQAFHIFEVEWSPEKITWFIDGKQVFETNRGKDTLDAMHNRPMFPILETQVGDGWVGPVDYSKNVTKQDSDYLVDWIRIYQEENHKKVSFDNLDHTADDGYHLNPIKQVGKLTFVSDGKEAYQDKNNFYYGGQPRYEKSRLYSSDNSQENALIYKIDQPQSIHLTTYYKTLEDAKSYSNAAAAYKGQSIRAHLVGQAIDFEVYSSVDGENWRKENVKVLDNFVEASPAYARTSFDVNQLSHDSRYVKVVFPNLKDKTYKNLKGQIKPIDNWDVQLAKVTFTR